MPLDRTFPSERTFILIIHEYIIQSQTGIHFALKIFSKIKFQTDLKLKFVSKSKDYDAVYLHAAESSACSSVSGGKQHFKKINMAKFRKIEIGYLFFLAYTW